MLTTYIFHILYISCHACMLYLLTFTNKNQPNVCRYASPMDGRYGYGICTLTRLKGFKSRFTKIQPHKCGGLGRDRVQADEWPHTKSEMVMGPWRCKHVSLITHPDTQWFRMISKSENQFLGLHSKKCLKHIGWSNKNGLPYDLCGFFQNHPVIAWENEGTKASPGHSLWPFWDG